MRLTLFGDLISARMLMFDPNDSGEVPTKSEGTISSKPLRPLVLSHYAERTGAPIALLRLLQCCVRDGAVKPAFLFAAGGPLLQSFAALGPCLNIRYPVLRRILYRNNGNHTDEARAGPFLLTRLLISMYCKYHRCDVILVNSVASMSLLSLCPTCLPRVTYVHELPSLIETILGPDGAAYVIKESSHILTVSSEVSATFLDAGISRSKVTCAPGTVPGLESLDRESRSRLRWTRLNASDDAVIVVGCGEPGLIKGTDLFLRVAGRVLESPDLIGTVAFRWIGFLPEDPGAVVLAREVARRGLTEDVAVMSSVPDAQDLIAAADIFLSTSREDANPLTVLEAAAAGLPTVCFSGAGGAEHIAKSGGGMAVPYLDDVAMAEAVLELVNDAQLRSELGKRARALTEKENSCSVVGRRVSDVLRRL